MRYIKVLFMAVAFVIAMIFFIQNTPVFAEIIQLKLEIFDWSWTSVEMPIYLVVLISFLAGAVLATIYFFFEKVRLASQLRAANSKVRKLEDEVRTLRAEKEQIGAASTTYGVASEESQSAAS